MPASKRRFVRRRDEGQALVEFALCLPVLLVFVMLAVQVGLIVLDQIALTQAAREAARVAAVDPAPQAAAAAARSGSRLDDARLEVRIEDAGPGQLRSSLSYRSEIRMPLTGSVLLAPVLEATAVMRRET